MMAGLPMLTTFTTNLAAQIGTETLVGQLFSFIVGLIVLTLVFYIAGRVVVGEKKALLSDAFVISLLGTIVASILGLFLRQWIGLILSLVIWLLLIRRYYETGWLGALAVAIMAVIIYIVILILLFLLLSIPLLLFEGLTLFLIC